MLWDVAAGREHHDRVGAPADRPRHLLDFLGDTGAHRRIADVGVDLDQKIAADRHRLEFEVIDVGGNDRSPSRYFLAHEFRRDEFGDGCAEAFAIGETISSRFHRLLARQVLAMGDIDHFFGDDPGAREFELGDELAGLACAQGARRGAERRQMIRRHIAVVLGLDRARLHFGEVAGFDPSLAHRLQALSEVDRCVAFGIGPGRIVDPHRRLARIGERDLAKRNADVGAAFGRGIHLARARNRPSGDTPRRGEFGNLVHGRLLADEADGGKQADQIKELGRCVPSPA